MDIRNYDVWKLADGQEGVKPFCICSQCDQPIVYEEQYYQFESRDRVHPECLEDYAKSSLAILKTAQ